MLKKLVVALEWILFGSLLGITASGAGDGLLSALPSPLKSLPLSCQLQFSSLLC